MSSREEIKSILTSILSELYPHPATLRKAKVIKTYDAEDTYLCDVEILNNDESVDESYPIISKVRIPQIVAGEGRGIIAPPEVDSLCDISFYNGDINYPVVSNFRVTTSFAKAKMDELHIANSSETFIKMDKEGILTIKSEKVVVDCKDATVTADTVVVESSKTVDIECADATVKADTVVVDSKDIKLGSKSAKLRLVTQDCPCQFTGAPHLKFTAKVWGE